MSIAELENRKQQYYHQIQTQEAEIKRYEKLYESLIRFKSTVARTQEEYVAANNQKRTTLSDLGSIRPHCLTAKTYETGMSRVLNLTGNQIARVTFETLLVRAQAKTTQYKNSIAACEEKIRNYRAEISSIDQEIAAIRRAEEEARRQREAARRAAEAAAAAASAGKKR